MRTRLMLSAIVGFSLCYTSSVGEIKNNPDKVHYVPPSLESTQSEVYRREPASAYEHSLATLSAKGLAEVELGRVYSAAVMTSMLLKAESAVRQAVSQMGMGPILAVQESSIQGFRARIIENLIKP